MSYTLSKLKSTTSIEPVRDFIYLLLKRLSLTAWYWKTVTNTSIDIFTIFFSLCCYVHNFTKFFFSPCPITVLNMNHFEDLLFLFYLKVCWFDMELPLCDVSLAVQLKELLTLQIHTSTTGAPHISSISPSFVCLGLKKIPLFPVTWVKKTRQGDKFIFIFYLLYMEKLHKHFNIIIMLMFKMHNYRNKFMLSYVFVL